MTVFNWIVVPNSNRLRHSHLRQYPGPNTWFDDINNTIHHDMEKRGHHDPINEDYYINISANSYTLKSVLILEEDYQEDFNHQNSIAKAFGFTDAKYTGGFHESENTIYSFFPEVSPGYKIIESPVKVPIAAN